MTIARGVTVGVVGAVALTLMLLPAVVAVARLDFAILPGWSLVNHLLVGGQAAALLLGLSYRRQDGSEEDS